MSYIAEIGGVTIVVVFLASLAHSALGVRRYTRFARWFRALPLPGASSSGAPVLFLLVELGAVVLLLMPATSRYGAALAAAMCVVFGAVTAYLASLPEPPSCACFGESIAPLGLHNIIRDLLLVVVSVPVLLRGAVWLPVPAASAMCAASGVVLGMLLVAWEDITFLVRDGRLADLSSSPWRSEGTGMPLPAAAQADRPNMTR